jgi:hypothetical protein
MKAEDSSIDIAAVKLSICHQGSYLQPSKILLYKSLFCGYILTGFMKKLRGAKMNYGLQRAASEIQAV